LHLRRRLQIPEHDEPFGLPPAAARRRYGTRFLPALFRQPLGLRARRQVRHSHGRTLRFRLSLGAAGRQPRTAVGYGTGEAHNKPGDGGNAGGVVNDLSKLGVRWVTDLTSAFHFMGPEGNLLFGSQNPARGNEGTCGGDSGGPLFFNDLGTSVEVGITSSGDAICRASPIIARTDSTRAVAFLSCVLMPAAKLSEVLACGCTAVDSQGECPASQ
jgi:Trypsin